MLLLLGMTLAGYECPEGSTASAVVICPVGKYSTLGMEACTECPVGRYADSEGSSSALCSGACPAGTYGATTGLQTATCTGPCAAGYYCPEGSTSDSSPGFVCPKGAYSLAGAAVCSDCDAGLFGDTEIQTSASCSGPCHAGKPEGACKTCVN